MRWEISYSNSKEKVVFRSKWQYGSILGNSVSRSESPRFDATTVIKLSLGNCFFQVRLSFQIYTTSMIKVVTIA